MKRTTLLAATALTATLLGGVAFADGNNSHGMKQGDKSGSAMMMQGDRQGMMDGKGMMQGDRQGMMDMQGMMKMMGGMEGMMGMMQQMHGNMMGNMMGKGHGNMMGGDMMRMLDADGDGTLTPEEMRAQLQAKLTEFDGAVTAEEMTAPADKLERMQKAHPKKDAKHMKPGKDMGKDMDKDMDSGSMMKDN